MVDDVFVFDTSKPYDCSECNAVGTTTAKCVSSQRSSTVDVETTHFTCSACGVTVEREDIVDREVTLTVL